MLTITGLISYRPAKPPEPEPKLSKSERRRLARAKAREEGRCGICVTNFARPGFSTCETCLAAKAARTKRE